jgi:uncharacterized damage-inducible protein DinB
MHKDEIILLYEYNRWANHRVLDACGDLTEAQLTAPAPVSHGSLMGTLAHIFGAEVAWRLRLSGGISTGRLVEAEDFLSLSQLTGRWRDEEQMMQSFLESLDEGNFERWVGYTMRSGPQEGNVLWKGLVHVVFHSSQFRGEAGAALAALGRSPGDLDFLQFLREADKR